MVPDLTQPTEEDWKRIEAKVDSLEEIKRLLEETQLQM